MPEQGGGPRGGHCPPPQYLADQLTLFPSWGPDSGFCPPFTTGTPKCFHLPASLCLTFTIFRNFRFVISYLKSHLIKVVFGPNTCWGLSQNGLSIGSASCKKKKKKKEWVKKGQRAVQWGEIFFPTCSCQLISKCPFDQNSNEFIVRICALLYKITYMIGQKLLFWSKRCLRFGFYWPLAIIVRTRFCVWSDFLIDLENKSTY